MENITEDTVVNIIDWCIDEILSELQCTLLYNKCNEQHKMMYSIDGYNIMLTLMDQDQKDRLNKDIKEGILD